MSDYVDPSHSRVFFQLVLEFRDVFSDVGMTVDILVEERLSCAAESVLNPISKFHEYRLMSSRILSFAYLFSGRHVLLSRRLRGPVHTESIYPAVDPVGHHQSIFAATGRPTTQNETPVSTSYSLESGTFLDLSSRQSGGHSRLTTRIDTCPSLRLKPLYIS